MGQPNLGQSGGQSGPKLDQSGPKLGQSGRKPGRTDGNKRQSCSTTWCDQSKRRHSLVESPGKSGKRQGSWRRSQTKGTATTASTSAGRSTSTRAQKTSRWSRSTSPRTSPSPRQKPQSPLPLSGRSRPTSDGGTLSPRPLSSPRRS